MWYNRVVDDMSRVTDAITYYNEELITAFAETKISGKLETQSQNIGGFMAHRYAQLQDLEAILKYFNHRLDRMRSVHYRKYLEAYNRELTDRAIEKYIDGEADVNDMYDIINEVALVRNKYLAVIKGLDTKQFQIGHIVKLRAAGLEDAQMENNDR